MFLRLSLSLSLFLSLLCLLRTSNKGPNIGKHILGMSTIQSERVLFLRFWMICVFWKFARRNENSKKLGFKNISSDADNCFRFVIRKFCFIVGGGVNMIIWIAGEEDGILLQRSDREALGLCK